MKKQFDGQANKGGIYQICNIENGKIYIGSCKRFKQRASEHQRRLNSNKHCNCYLQNAWNKHGPESFIFEVLEVIEGDKLQRTTREKEYLQKYYENWEKCYNFQKNPICKQGPWSSTPEETKKKLRSLMVGNKNPMKKEENKKKFRGMENPAKRKDVRKKISQSKIIFYSNLANRIKASLCKNNTKKKIRLWNSGEEYYFESLSKASKELNLDISHLCNVLKKKRKSHKGYKAEYVK